jgi:hypothetical protein
LGAHLLLIVYDEHGGFYDHVSPDDFTPPGGLPDQDRRFRRYGPRVPAIVVSPWVETQRHSHTLFDHTSIINTALLRFCGDHAEECIEAMGPRVAQARHLGELLSRETPREPPSLDENKIVEPLVRWRAREIRRRLTHPLADEPSLVSVEPAHAGMVVFNKLRNGVVEQLSQILRWRPRLPGTPKPPPMQLQQPRHDFEQSIFTGARELRRRGLPTGHP